VNHKVDGNLPTRVVFQLEPHGVGTWGRQRLSSYIQELAVTSFLLPSKVRGRFGAAPYTPAQHGNYIRFNRVNGASEVARNWVANFEPLVGRRDLSDLTLLPFARFLRSGSSFIYPRRRWCPRCLQDDAAAGRMPYERLLWVLEPVLVCPLHEVYLEDVCPHCQGTQVTEISRNCLPGHCGHCGHWLGKPAKSQFVPTDTQHFLYHVWCARDAANLLAMSNDEIEAASYENFRIMLQYGLREKFPDMKPKLIALTPGRTFVYRLLSGDARPSLVRLSRLAWMFGVPMRSWLSGEISAWRSAYCRELPSGVTLRVQHRYLVSKRADIEAMAVRLRESVAGGNPYLSARAAAKAENISIETFISLLPEEYALVREKGAALRADRTAANHEEKHDVIHRMICELVAEGIEPSQSAMVKKCKEYSVSFAIRNWPLWQECRAALGEETLTIDRATCGR
jgi:hypothetical protein